MARLIGVWIVLVATSCGGHEGSMDDDDGTGQEEAGTAGTESEDDDRGGGDNGEESSGDDDSGAGSDETGTNDGTDDTGSDDTGDTGTDDTGSDDTGTNDGTDDTGSDDTGTDPDPPPGPCTDPERNESDFTHVYHVGPGHEYSTPSDVPWESVEPGTLVLIHWRAEPYRDKWVIATEGTADEPVVVRGVPNGDALPIITGEDASTRPELDFWNEERAVIKIGGSSAPGGTPSHVSVEFLEIRSGHPAYGFTNAAGGMASYTDNAASIFVEAGNDITIRGCDIHDSGNGLFVAYQASEVTVVANAIHGNGISGSIYEHNSYTEAQNITFQCNYYGRLRDGAGGNNLKDRSAGTVIRYNWLEGGNRQLDLVESDHDELVDDPAYRETFVYGNVLVEADGEGNRQIVHYGGDGDVANYRNGTLYLFHNTLVSTRTDRTSLVRLSTNDESALVHGNIVFVTAGGSELEIAADGTGDITLSNNWLSEGWTHSFVGSPSGSLVDSGNLSGIMPGFAALATEDFRLVAGSPAIDAAGAPPTDTADHPVTHQYLKHSGHEGRPDDSLPDMGAFERPGD